MLVILGMYKYFIIIFIIYCVNINFIFKHKSTKVISVNQTILHIITERPITKFHCGHQDIFNTSQKAIEWIKNLDLKL
jgi:hypothetical protein